MPPASKRLIFCHSTAVFLTGPKGFLIFARKETLHRVSLDTPDRTDIVLPVSDLESLMDVDFDPVDKFIYWSDKAKDVIKRSRMDGTGMYLVWYTAVFSVVTQRSSWGGALR